MNLIGLEVFLQYLRQVPLLDKKELTTLISKAQAGDADAKERLMKHNLRLIVHVAKKHYTRHDLLDHIQDGVVGLSNAIDTYSPDFNTTFSTYAATCIHQAMHVERFNKQNNIRIPVEATRQRHMLNKLMQTNPRMSLAELEEHTGFSKVTIQRLLTIPEQPLSMETKTFSNYQSDSDLVIGSTIADPNSTDYIEELAKNDVKRLLREALDNLKPIERKILNLVYGLDGAKELDRQEVGKLCGFSRQRVYQIELVALQKIAKSDLNSSLRGLL